MALSALHAVLILTSLGSVPGGFGSLAEVRALFSDDRMLRAWARVGMAEVAGVTALRAALAAAMFAQALLGLPLVRPRPQAFPWSAPARAGGARR